MKNSPLKTIRIGFINATIWFNEPYYSVTITRAFKDADGNWSDTTNFNHADLPVVALLAKEAEAFIRSQK